MTTATATRVRADNERAAVARRIRDRRRENEGNDWRWQIEDPENGVTSLSCDCGGGSFTVLREPDDTLLLVCNACTGRALVIGLWEEL